MAILQVGFMDAEYYITTLIYIFIPIPKQKSKAPRLLYNIGSRYLISDEKKKKKTFYRIPLYVYLVFKIAVIGSNIIRCVVYLRGYLRVNERACSASTT